MSIINASTLQTVDQNAFDPQNIVEHLGFIPDIFDFLKNKEDTLGKSRPAVTYVVALTVWAFRQETQNEARELPKGFLDVLWKKISEENAGEYISELMEKLEPTMWNYFLRLIQGAYQKEEWSQQDLTAAALVYGTILTCCILMFWPEDSLVEIENTLQNYGLYRF